MNFRDPISLKQHAQAIFEFYHPRCVDEKGGFFHIYLDNGDTQDQHKRHLVNSTRFVINYARMSKLLNSPSLLKYCSHGIDFIKQKHQHTQGFYWELDLSLNSPKSTADYCYGWAFMLLMYAECIQHGLNHLTKELEQTYAAMEDKFWESTHHLYSDDADTDGNISHYRGQNANMHSCEALLSAFKATRKQEYLQRAYEIASKICVDLATPKESLIWEHYDKEWAIDWEYNRDKPNDMFKPWGFQTGHQTEWSKLLLILYQYQPEEWMKERASYLFHQALTHGWDHEHGGLYYGFAPNGECCDSDKHFWVHAESFAAAAYLAIVNQDDHYWQHYDAIWAYAWEHLVDHRHGAWFHKTSREGNTYSTIKSPLGKCDYHTIGACYDVLNALEMNQKRKS